MRTTSAVAAYRGPGASGAGAVAAHGAAVLAFGYAVVSLYWAVGGRGLLSTVGGYVQQLADRGGAGAVLVAVVVLLAKVAGGVLALALIRPSALPVSRRWLLTGAGAVSVLLVIYGAVNVAAGALVLSGAIHPAGSVDRTALRWHVAVWDLWFLVWGMLLAVATVSCRRAARGPVQVSG
jgi:Protein of unknown function (DUF3995)